MTSRGARGVSARRLIYGDYGNGTVVVTLNRNTPNVPGEIYSPGTEEDWGRGLFNCSFRESRLLCVSCPGIRNENGSKFCETICRLFPTVRCNLYRLEIPFVHHKIYVHTLVSLKAFG